MRFRLPKNSATPADDYLVALARESGAEAIVTGDKDLLDHPGLEPAAIGARSAASCSDCSTEPQCGYFSAMETRKSNQLGDSFSNRSGSPPARMLRPSYPRSLSISISSGTAPVWISSHRTHV